MSTFSSVAKSAAQAIQKNSPAILTALGAAGVIATAVLAVKATPVAMSRIQKAEEEKFDEDSTFDGFTKWGKAKIVWTLYLPAAGVGVATIGCIVGINTIHNRRGAALASIYAITERALEEYQNKVVEVVGDKKEQFIRDEIAQDRLIANPVEDKQVHILSTGGEQLFMDALSGRYFMSTMQLVQKAVNDTNAELISSSYVRLNDLYDRWGLEETVLGAELGWIPDNLIELKFSAKIATNDVPCIVIDYRAEPTVDYYRTIQ